MPQSKAVNAKNKNVKKTEAPPQPYGPELPESVKMPQLPSESLSKDKKISSVSNDKEKCENIKDMQSASNVGKNDDVPNKDIEIIEESSGVINIFF